MRFDFYNRSKGNCPSKQSAPPQHSTRELAAELGLPTMTLHWLLRRDGAPKPTKRFDEAHVGCSPNRGNNYYNRQEVFAFLRQIGVVK